MMRKEIAKFSFMASTVFIGVLLTACGAMTPEQQAAAKQKRAQKYAQLTVREYLGRANRAGDIVPLPKTTNTLTDRHYSWWPGAPETFTPYNVDSQDAEFCEAKGGKLEYRGSVTMPGLRQDAYTRLADARNYPETIGETKSISDSISQQSELQSQLGRFSQAVARAISQRYFGKFECIDAQKRPLFSVAFAPTSITRGDYESGIKTSVGASVYWSRTYQVP